MGGRSLSLQSKVPCGAGILALAPVSAEPGEKVGMKAFSQRVLALCHCSHGEAPGSWLMDFGMICQTSGPDRICWISPSTLWSCRRQLLGPRSFSVSKAKGGDPCLPALLSLSLAASQALVISGAVKTGLEKGDITGPVAQ